VAGLGGMGKRSPGKPGRSLPVEKGVKTRANKLAHATRYTLSSRPHRLPWPPRPATAEDAVARFDSRA
jgi:hypothetical protein